MGRKKCGEKEKERENRGGGSRENFNTFFSSLSKKGEFNRRYRLETTGRFLLV
jgi:hypothetical protein